MHDYRKVIGHLTFLVKNPVEVSFIETLIWIVLILGFDNNSFYIELPTTSKLFSPVVNLMFLLFFVTQE